MTVHKSHRGTIGWRVSTIAAYLFPLMVASAFCQALDSFSPALDSFVYPTIAQADGKILMGGQFTSVNGQTRNHIARLNQDGSVDMSFNPGASNAVNCLAVHPGGGILVGGAFTNLAGVPRNYIGRLDADGNLDPLFDPGADAAVASFAIQTNGQILVGGSFTNCGGRPRHYLARLNANGKLDSSFDPGANGPVDSFAVQPDGKIIVAGSFTILAGTSRTNIGRLDSAGNIDASFLSSADNSVFCLALQTDGKILASGGFTKLGGQTHNFIGRLNPDGTADTNFNASADKPVLPIALQADGKILIGGQFTKLAGQSHVGLGRLNPDGTLDTSFSVATCCGTIGSTVYSIVPQADGKTLIGGYFSTLGGQPRTFIGRLNNGLPAPQSLTLDDNTLTWGRGGAGPEIWSCTFEASSNGADWSLLGTGSRIQGGWQLGGLTIPPGSTVRARGFVLVDDSAWFVETTRPSIGNFGIRAGQFGFSVIGSPERSVVLERSTDLINWGVLATNVLTNGSLDFSDPDPPTVPSRFYRVRSL